MDSMIVLNECKRKNPLQTDSIKKISLDKYNIEYRFENLCGWLVWGLFEKKIVIIPL